MRFDPRFNTLFLSRRNLQTLLNKLDDPSSTCTLIEGSIEHGNERPPMRVIAQSDSAHYGSRPAGAVDHDPGRDDNGPVE